MEYGVLSTHARLTGAALCHNMAFPVLVEPPKPSNLQTKKEIVVSIDDAYLLERCQQAICLEIGSDVWVNIVQVSIRFLE
jgi:hypothetical protein